MTNHKKRLKKGIDSLTEQITLHEQKLRKAEEENNFELAGYYKKELFSKRKDKEEKERLLEKGG